jgi:hypothetical protein
VITEEEEIAKALIANTNGIRLVLIINEKGWRNVPFKIGDAIVEINHVKNIGVAIK